MNIDETLKTNLIADVENICDTNLRIQTMEALKRAFEITIGHHHAQIKEAIEKWISVEDKLPEQGYEVLLFNKRWINEDFNPKGIRIGFLDDLSGWVSAYWCNTHDDYHTRISEEDDNQFTDFEGKNQIPTHWMEIKAV